MIETKKKCCHTHYQNLKKLSVFTPEKKESTAQFIKNNSRNKVEKKQSILSQQLAPFAITLPTLALVEEI
jgi:hypothetical protein